MAGVGFLLMQEWAERPIYKTGADLNGGKSVQIAPVIVYFREFRKKLVSTIPIMLRR